jgi:cell division protein FtsB
MTTEPNRRRRWRRLAFLLLLLLLGYGTYRAVRPDPNLKRVRQLQQEFAAQGKDLTPDQRRERGQQMREAMAKLSPTQRETLFAEGQQRFQQDLERYHKMSQAEKVRYLDERINRDEERRRQFAQRNQNGNGPRPNGGGPGAFGAGPGGSGGRGGQPPSAEEREKRRKERIDRTTPEFRALMDQFRRDMNARRQQRGLSTSGR